MINFVAVAQYLVVCSSISAMDGKWYIRLIRHYEPGPNEQAISILVRCYQTREFMYALSSCSILAKNCLLFKK